MSIFLIFIKVDVNIICRSLWIVLLLFLDTLTSFNTLYAKEACVDFLI